MDFLVRIRAFFTHHEGMVEAQQFPLLNKINEIIQTILICPIFDNIHPTGYLPINKNKYFLDTLNNQRHFLIEQK
jgi:hypothetical protein